MIKHNKPAFGKPLACGCIALVLWSFSAIGVSKLSIPAFESLFFAILAGFLSCVLYLSVFKKWQLCTQPLSYWVLVSTTLIVNNICFYLAFNYCSPILIDIVCWSWPLFYLVIHNIIQVKSVSRWHWISCLFGISAIVLTFPKTQVVHQWIGILLATLSAFAWCSYQYIVTFYKKAPAETTTLCMSISTPLVYYCHLHFEKWVTPNNTDCTILVILGAGSFFAAFALWHHAMQNGPRLSLAQLSFLTPLLSMIWLIWLGHYPVSNKTTAAIICMVVSIMLSLNFLAKQQKQAQKINTSVI